MRLLLLLLLVGVSCEDRGWCKLTYSYRPSSRLVRRRGGCLQASIVAGLSRCRLKRTPEEEKMKVLVVVHAQINSLTLVLAHSRPFKQTFSIFSTFGKSPDFRPFFSLKKRRIVNFSSSHSLSFSCQVFTYTSYLFAAGKYPIWKQQKTELLITGRRTDKGWRESNSSAADLRKSGPAKDWPALQNMASFFLSLEKKNRPQSRLQTSYIIDLFSPSLVTITNICHATSAVLAYFILSRLRPQPTATSELSPFQL